MADMERELARMREMRAHKVQYGNMRKNAVQDLKLAYIDSDRIYGPKRNCM